MRQYPMPLRIVWVLLEHALIGFTMAQVSFAVVHVEVFGTKRARWWPSCLRSLSVTATFNANREIGRVYGWCLPRTKRTQLHSQGLVGRLRLSMKAVHSCSMV